MKTIPTAQRVAGILVSVLMAFSLSSCSDETAPQGATIVPPGDLTVSYSGVPGTGSVDSWNVPLGFQVLDANGKPLPGIRIRFFGDNMILQLADRADTITAVPLDPSNPTSFETTTNDQGIPSTDIFAHWVIVPCGGSTSDINTSGNVVASIDVATVEWKVDITTDCTP